MKRTLLIVDDSELTRAVLRELLEAEGYGVHEVCDGAQALEWLKGNPAPSLILLDLAMPVMTGVEFLRAVSARGDQETLSRVLVMSADRRDLERLGEFALCSVFEKPFSMRELVKRVGECAAPGKS